MDQAETATQNPGKSYNLSGVVSDIQEKQTKDGKPFLRFRFAFTAAGRNQMRTALAFGHAYHAMKGNSPRHPGKVLAAGDCRLFVKFTEGTLSVVSHGFEALTIDQRAEREAAERAATRAREAEENAARDAAEAAALAAAKPKRSRASRRKAATQSEFAAAA